MNPTTKKKDLEYAVSKVEVMPKGSPLTSGHLYVLTGTGTHFDLPATRLRVDINALERGFLSSIPLPRSISFPKGGMDHVAIEEPSDHSQDKKNRKDKEQRNVVTQFSLPRIIPVKDAHPSRLLGNFKQLSAQESYDVRKARQADKKQGVKPQKPEKSQKRSDTPTEKQQTKKQQPQQQQQQPLPTHQATAPGNTPIDGGGSVYTSSFPHFFGCDSEGTGHET